VHERGEPLARPGELVVLKLSGSLIYPPSSRYLSKLVSVISELVGMGFKLGIVVGGGPLARGMIDSLRELGVGEALLDMIGIEASRLNASLLAKLLYPRSPLTPPLTLEEALRALQLGLIPVMGGLQPGQSTNAVAAVLAEAGDGKLVLNALKGVKGVMEGGPGGRLIEGISYEEMRRLIEGFESAAGTYTLWDKVALEVVKRSGIRVVFFDGSEPRNIIEALTGSIGTVMGE